MLNVTRAVGKALREAGVTSPWPTSVTRAAAEAEKQAVARAALNTIEHQWPSDLTEEGAACEVCGLPYDEFSVDDAGCLSWPERRRREHEALWQTEGAEDHA